LLSSEAAAAFGLDNNFGDRLQVQRILAMLLRQEKVMGVVRARAEHGPGALE
jgi:predicted NodU family carbamoyl transferase